MLQRGSGLALQRGSGCRPHVCASNGWRLLEPPGRRFSRARRRRTPTREIANFYRDSKTILIVVGVDVGGGYDVTARVLARYLGKYIPGRPSIVIRNQSGASSILARANNVVNVAAQDGTVIAAVQRNIPAQFLFDMTGVQFDLGQLQWVGNTAKEPGVFVSSKSAPQKTLKDLQTTEMFVGGNGPRTDSEINARVLNSVFGTKLKIVSGYPGQNQMVLSMQRGEIQGIANWSWSDILLRHPDLLTSNSASTCSFTSRSSRSLSFPACLS